MSITFMHTHAWGDVGRALFDVPDTELAGLAAALQGPGHCATGPVC